MKTLLGLLILAQMPFVAIAFFAAGTDGKASSQLTVWAFVIPIGLCQAYTVYRLAFGSGWGTKADYLSAAMSCAPLFYLLVVLVVQNSKLR